MSEAAARCFIMAPVKPHDDVWKHLRAVLTNAPNSCPPERLFSMFNATFGEDQKSAFGDYLELAMQSQYNKRNA